METAHDFVGDEQYPVAVADVAQPGHEAGRCRDHAAVALDCFDDHRSHRHPARGRVAQLMVQERQRGRGDLFGVAAER